MEPEYTEQPEQPEQTEQPAAPAIDSKLALEIAAQQFGVTPDYLEGAVRLQDENRRQIEYFSKKERELERREAQAEALSRERQQYTPQEPQYEIDPIVRPLYEEMKSMKQEWQRERQERVQQMEHQEQVKKTAQDLERHYLSAMRGVPSQNQVDQDRFFSAMGEIYPTTTGQLPEGITPEKAVYFTAKYLGLNPSGMSNGSYSQPNNNPMTNRRASVVIPSPQTGPGPSAQSGFGAEPQRQAESNEDYLKRLLIEAERRGIRGLRDGQKVSSS